MASCQNYSGCSNCDVISWVSIINSSPRLYNFTYWFSCNNLISLILMSLQIYRIRECLASGSKVCATAVEMWRYVSSVKQREGEIVQNWDSNYSPGCCASFCFWCLNYKTAENLGKSGLLYTLLGCIMPCIPIMLARTEARERYNIEVRGEERQGGSWRVIIVCRETRWEMRWPRCAVVAVSCVRQVVFLQLLVNFPRTDFIIESLDSCY